MESSKIFPKLEVRLYIVAPLSGWPHEWNSKSTFALLPIMCRSHMRACVMGSRSSRRPNWLSHLEFDWQSPIWRHCCVSFARSHLHSLRRAREWFVRLEGRGSFFQHLGRVAGLNDLQPGSHSHHPRGRPYIAIVFAALHSAPTRLWNSPGTVIVIAKPFTIANDAFAKDLRNLIQQVSPHVSPLTEAVSYVTLTPLIRHNLSNFSLQ